MRTKARRGVALIAALWIVVAIAAVALQLALDAHDRRQLGLAASERGVQLAAANGALGLLQARLDQALRTTPSGTGAVAALRASDPWLGIDSIYSGTYYVDSMPVNVSIKDLGTQLNVNSMNEQQLTTFFSWVLKDQLTATKIAQCIMDWRDADSIPRPEGAERDQYIKDGKLALPTNAPFRELSELLNVENMTPDIYAQVAPYLRTRGDGTVNINTAPEAVLRALPGMTDQILVLILAQRSHGQRISSLSQVIPTAAGAGGRGVAIGGRGGRGGAPGAPDAIYMQLQTQLAASATVTTNQIEITLTAKTGPQAQPVRLIADLSRAGAAGLNTNVTYRQW
jgi:type II secretory pathway component PulK